MNNIFNDIWYLYKWISFKRKIQLFFLVGFSIFVSLMEMITVGSVVPFVTSIINAELLIENKLVLTVQKIFNVENNDDLIFLFATIFIIFAIITGICRSVLIYFISRYSNVVLAQIGSELYNKKLNEPYIKFISKSSDEIISLISSKLLQIYGVISGVLLFLTSLILFLSLIGILLFIDFKLTLISISVFGILYLLVVLTFRKHY